MKGQLNNMRLQISSRTGHFNLLNPNEESISCNIRVFDDNDNRLHFANITLDYEWNPTIPTAQEAIDIIVEHYEHMFISTSREKDMEFVEFLKLHKKEIDEGTRKARIKLLLKKKTDIIQEIKELRQSL